MRGVYSIRDLKTTYGPLICDLNDEAAKRGFFMAIEYGQNELSKAPQDFELVHLADFDEDTGELLPCLLEIVATGYEYILGKEKKVNA